MIILAAYIQKNIVFTNQYIHLLMLSKATHSIQYRDNLLLHSRLLVGMGASCLLWFNEKMPGATTAMLAMATGVWCLSTSPSESVVSLSLPPRTFLLHTPTSPLAPAVPLAPTGLRLKNLSSTSANIHWDRVSSSYPPVHVIPQTLLMNIHNHFSPTLYPPDVPCGAQTQPRPETVGGTQCSQ